MKGKIDNNLNIEGMIKPDFSDVVKQLDKLIKDCQKRYCHKCKKNVLPIQKLGNKICPKCRTILREKK